MSQSTSKSTAPRARAYSNRQFHDWLDLLQHFQSEFGHCQVKRDQPGYTRLAEWCHRIRKNRKRGKAQPYQIEALDGIGFEWELKSSPLKFSDAIAMLVQFKKIHGHCAVPYSYPRNQRLAVWAHNQRAQYHRLFRRQSCYLTEDKIKSLIDVGLFDFRS